MSADYTPQIGDRVRKQGWAEAFWFDVLAIDGDRMWVRHENKHHNTYVIGDYPWVKVEPVVPLPERWWYINCGSGNVGLSSSSSIHPDGPNVAVLHIWTDADGNDHAEIERVAQ